MVLILVLVEFPFGVINVYWIAKLSNGCLNPCFSGISFRSIRGDNLLIICNFSLNPCFSGISFRRIITLTDDQVLEVLILVLVEFPFGVNNAKVMAKKIITS